MPHILLDGSQIGRYYFLTMNTDEQNPFSAVVAELSLTGDRALESNWHRHSNGGGWVENCSIVDDSAFVGPGAIVYGKDTLVHNGAKVFGKHTLVGDGARVGGKGTLVCNGALVHGR